MTVTPRIPRRPRTATAKTATVLGIGSAAALFAAALPLGPLPDQAIMALVVVIASVAHLVAGRLVRAGRTARSALLMSTTLLVVLAPLATHGSPTIQPAGPLWIAVGVAFGPTSLASLWTAVSRPPRLPWIRGDRSRFSDAIHHYR